MLVSRDALTTEDQGGAGRRGKEAAYYPNVSSQDWVLRPAIQREMSRDWQEKRRRFWWVSLSPKKKEEGEVGWWHPVVLCYTWRLAA